MADTSQGRPVDPRVIRDRLSLWESKVDAKAPLSKDQRDLIHDLSLIAADRPLPTNVSIVESRSNVCVFSGS